MGKVTWRVHGVTCSPEDALAFTPQAISCAVAQHWYIPETWELPLVSRPSRDQSRYEPRQGVWKNFSASVQSMKPKMFSSFIHSFQIFGFSVPRSAHSIFRRPESGNERRCYIVTMYLIGWAHTLTDLWVSCQKACFPSHWTLSPVSISSEMCSERDSPLEPFVLPAPGQPELARLICGAHLSPPVLTRKQKRPRVNSLVCDRAAALYAAGPPEALSRMSRLVTQAAERERELARARSQRLKQAARSLPGESVSRGFAGRGALEGYPSHYTSLISCKMSYHEILWSLEAARFVFRIVRSLWNLTGSRSVTLLPMCLSNFKAMW